MPVPLPPAPPSKEEVIRRLREAMPTLRRLYVEQIELFGSVARDEQQPGSDIDLCIKIDERGFEREHGHGMTLFDLGEIQATLEDLFDAPVGLVVWQDTPSRFKDRVDREALRVA